MITYLKNGPIKEVEAEGKCEQRNLPSEYTQVEYLDSTGTQFIATGIPVSDDLAFGYKASPTTINQLSISQLRTTSAGGRSGLIVWQSGGNIDIRYVSGGSQFNTKTNVRYVAGQVFDIIFNDNNNFYINGVLAYTKTNTIDTSGVLVTGTNDAIYNLWVKSNTDGSLIFNGIPCRRKSDNVLGMYDTVTGNFLTNAGTGDFVAGPDVVPTPDTPMDIVSNNGVLKARHQSGLPLGYTLLDYVESGRATIIDIYAPTQDTEITTTFAPRNTRSDLIANTATTDGVRYGFYYNTERGWCYAIGKAMVISGIKTGYGVDEWATVRMDRTGFYVNGTLIGSDVNPDNFTAAPAIDFARDVSAVKWRSFIVRENGALVMNLIPAQNSGGVVGMYDLVSGQFFTSSNSYAFTAGDPVPNPVEIYTDGTVETINVHGKNLFDPVNNLKVGYYLNNTNGAETPSSDGSSSCFLNYLPSEPNKTYTMSKEELSTSKTYLRMIAYDKDKNFIASVINSTSTFGKGTTPANTAYIRCSFGTLGTYNEWVQVEEGSTATAYEPYIDIGTATTEMLLKVGNYKDTLYILDGTVNRNVGIYVFDGTEDFTKGTAFYTTNLHFLPSPFANITPVCTHFNGIASLDERVGDSLTIAVNGADSRTKLNRSWRGCVYIYADRSQFSTANDFKQYLADQYANGTPVIVVYPLEEPTTEYVIPQISNPDNKDITATVIDGSLDDLVVNIIDYIPYVKKRYVTDDAGNLTEVKKVYKGNLLVYSK